MTGEQWLGVLILAVGVYFIVCSRWKRDFILYDLKVARVRNIFGETFAHTFYFLLGIAAAVSGLLKALGIWGPPA